MVTTTTSNTILTTSYVAPKSKSKNFLFGLVIGTSVALVLVCLPLAIMAFCLWRKKRAAEKHDVAPFEDEDTATSSWPVAVSRQGSRGFATSQGSRPGSRGSSSPESPSPSMPASPGREPEMPDTARIATQDGTPFTGTTFHEWQGGATYSGQVCSGLRHGVGRMMWPNGKSYTGQWDGGRPHGHGLWHAQGDRGWTYNGQFMDGQRHGNGRCESLKRQIWYDGDWHNGVQSGMGERGSLADMSQHGMSPSPCAHIWWMEQGHPKEYISVSNVVPESDDLIDVGAASFPLRASLEIADCDCDCVIVSLEAAAEDYAAKDHVNYTVGQLQLVSRLWGICVGVPDVWLPSRWGALIITHIAADTPSGRWNDEQLSGFGSGAFAIHPNSLIWQVNGVQGDSSQMVRELCAEEGRQRLRLAVTNPPHIRITRQLGIRWGERPPQTELAIPSAAPLEQESHSDGLRHTAAAADAAAADSSFPLDAAPQFHVPPQMQASRYSNTQDIPQLPALPQLAAATSRSGTYTPTARTMPGEPADFPVDEFSIGTAQQAGPSGGLEWPTGLPGEVRVEAMSDNELFEI